jgi:hypothetical protein
MVYVCDASELLLHIAGCSSLAEFCNSRLVGVRDVEIYYIDEIILVFPSSDVWHVAPIVNAVLGVGRRRRVKDPWSTRSIERIGQVVDFGGGRRIVHYFASSDHDDRGYNTGRDEHFKRKQSG